MARSQDSGSLSPTERRAAARDQARWLAQQERDQHRARVAEIDEELAGTKRHAKEQHSACAQQLHEVRADASREAAAGRKSIALTRHEAEARARAEWRAARVRLTADKDARIAEQASACQALDAEAREEADRLAGLRKQERRDARALRLTERHQVEREKERPKPRRESTEERIDALTSEVERSAPELIPYLRSWSKRALVQLVNDETLRASPFERFAEIAQENEEDVAATLADAYSDEDFAAQQEAHMRAAGVPF